MLSKLSYLNSNIALTLGYLNPALNNSALVATEEVQWTIRLSDYEMLFIKEKKPSLNTQSDPILAICLQHICIYTRKHVTFALQFILSL